MKAKDVMTRDVKSCRPESNLAQAGALMWDYDCGVLPVADDAERVMGLITDRDITVRLVALEADARNAAVSDCMTREAIACHADEPIRECMRQMSRHQIRRLPIVNAQNQVIGMLSQSDLARYAGNYPGHE
jgi:CBS domain-containing protein